MPIYQCHTIPLGDPSLGSRSPSTYNKSVDFGFGFFRRGGLILHSFEHGSQVPGGLQAGSALLIGVELVLLLHLLLPALELGLQVTGVVGTLPATDDHTGMTSRG